MARHGSLLLAAWAVACIGVPASAYYLPGTYPQEFLPGQQLQGEQCIALASVSDWTCHDAFSSHLPAVHQPVRCPGSHQTAAAQLIVSCLLQLKSTHSPHQMPSSPSSTIQCHFASR